jgi:hypothetical protein
VWRERHARENAPKRLFFSIHIDQDSRNGTENAVSPSNLYGGSTILLEEMHSIQYGSSGTVSAL